MFQGLSIDRVSKWLRASGALGLLALFGSACMPPTSFEGESKFPGGAQACFHKCRKQHMEMASFVYVGEFATACACKPTVASDAAPRAATDDDASAAIVAASAGVELQRRRIEQQRNRQIHTPPPMMVH